MAHQLSGASFWCWWLPEVQLLCQAPHTNLLTLDFCQYGAAWRKRTHFLTGFLDLQDTARLTKVCSGRPICSRTGKPHIQLTGSYKGKRWTQIAQPYPAALNKALAYWLTCPLRFRSTLQATFFFWDCFRIWRRMFEDTAGVCISRV